MLATINSLLIKPGRILTLLVVCLFSFSMIGQTFEWLKTQSIDYDYNPSMVLYTTASDSEENAYFIGVGEFDGTQPVGYGSLFLKKYNSEGSLLYDKMIYGKASILGAVCDDENNILFYGNHQSTLNLWDEDEINYDGSSDDLFLVKLDDTGTILWTRNLNQLFPSINLLSEVIVHGQGDIWFGIGNWGDSHVIKIDGNGNVVDSIAQIDVNHISGIDIDEDGNVYVTGSCSGETSLFGGVNFPSPFTYSMYLTKYNPVGEPEWVTFTEDITCLFPSVKTGENGNIYWSGQLAIKTLFGDIQAEGPEWVYDFFLAKADSDGEFEWLREVPQVTTGDATIGQLDFIDIQQNGNIVLGGKTRGLIEWEEGLLTDVTDNYYEIIVWEFNPGGGLNWVKTAGGEAYDQVHGVSCTPTGNVYVAGSIGGNAVFDTIANNSEDFVYPFLAKLNTQELVSVITPVSKTSLKVYPNPAHDKLCFDNSNIKSITIYTASGKPVAIDAIVKSSEIKIQNLKSGFYLLKAEDYDGKIMNSRFVKR